MSHCVRRALLYYHQAVFFNQNRFVALLRLTVKYMMEDTLHYLVKKSLEEYVQFIEHVCEFDVTPRRVYLPLTVVPPLPHAMLCGG